MPYSISLGWNTKELVRGIYGEGKPRLLGAYSRPVETLKEESGVNLLMDWMTVLCVLQIVGETAEVLRPSSMIHKTSTP